MKDSPMPLGYAGGLLLPCVEFPCGCPILLLGEVKPIVLTLSVSPREGKGTAVLTSLRNGEGTGVLKVRFGIRGGQCRAAVATTISACAHHGHVEASHRTGDGAGDRHSSSLIRAPPNQTKPHSTAAPLRNELTPHADCLTLA